MAEIGNSSHPAATSGRHGLWSASFVGLLATQLLTAMKPSTSATFARINPIASARWRSGS